MHKFIFPVFEREVEIEGAPYTIRSDRYSRSAVAEIAKTNDVDEDIQLCMVIKSILGREAFAEIFDGMMPSLVDLRLLVAFLTACMQESDAG